MDYDKKRAIYVAHMLNKQPALRGIIKGKKEELVERFKKEYDDMSPDERAETDKECDLF
ncbi:MAG: hypothetical protein ACE5J7_04095 [Candidatus Aenigmatarchaeota archaeon]